MNTGKPASCVFIDYSKAFSRVYYKSLINKLEVYEINDKIQDLMQRYLSAREQEDNITKKSGTQSTTRKGS